MRLDDAIGATNVEHPTDLYRYYDHNGQLLYVGVSKSAVMRAMQHEHTAGWWDAWTYMTRQQYPSRTSALAAEYEAIRNERPAHNVAHNMATIITLKGRT